MSLKKLLWIIEIIAILYGAGTQAFPMFSGKNLGTRIALSFIETDFPTMKMEDGFCVQPKFINDREIKVADENEGCAPAWTMTHSKKMRAVEEMLEHKDLPALLKLKRTIEKRIPELTLKKSQKK